MGDRSSIEWTEATWNPVTGCTKVSAGCDNCYAEGIARRFAGTPAYPNGFGVTLRPERLPLPLRWKRPRRIFVNSMSDLFHDDVPDEFITQVFAVMAQASHHTFQILTKRHARMRAFLNDFCRCGSGHVAGVHLRSNMSWAGTPHSPTYVPGVDGNAVYFDRSWPLPNVWVGVSVEDQKHAELRIPALLETPAAVRFISAEPLLGPIDLRNLRARNGALIDALGGDVKTSDGRDVYSCCPSVLDWVIVGGESGRHARPMHPNWARSLRDQCATASASFHFKQWGEWGPAPWSVRIAEPSGGWKSADPAWLAAEKAKAEKRGATHHVSEDGHLYEPDHKTWSLERDSHGDYPGAVRRWGKKTAGRELDGRTWDEYPDFSKAVAA
ncbi:DUF5131 family protein [Herbidospora sp. NEAU-GS84]|uniref:DUF5131 family protein n=1 Tax=Herbidospora solisilvae TaxID=2696284 RepID=A0A7C9N2L4_9ACTN|nr:phage Gp37/Gp68 family protein [Herbidospora solisilvae]NAS22454.1 DUF5131 family protein [Herbidospora solisilvae]